ncbi:MAG: T9SS type A sorting domain-containing protein [Bacteroidota bacterium]
MKKILTTLLLMAGAAAHSQTVTTYMGTAGVFPTSNILSSSTIANAKLFGPSNMCKDTSGKLWFVEGMGNRVRYITGTDVYVRAGSLAGDAGSNDATSTAATFNGPSGIAIDKLGNIYVVDNYNSIIRKVTPFANIPNGQTVSTFAGDKLSSGFADGTGTAAKFNMPVDIIVDANNNLYVTDAENHRIRKITPAGVVTTFAGSGTVGSADGIGTAATFSLPSGMCWYNATEFLVTDLGLQKIRKVNITTGAVTTVAGKGTYGTDDGDALTVATFSVPTDVAVDDMKNIYVTDNNAIRKIHGSCVITFAGAITDAGTVDGNGTGARFDGLSGIFYADNVLYVFDKNNHTIRKVTVPVSPPTLPKANFDASKTSGTTSDVINFRDSSENAVEWNWSITPGTIMFHGGTSLTSQNPEVMFMADGMYTVSLKVKSMCFGSDSTTKTSYVKIGAVGLPTVISEATVSVYPNPSKGLINITSSLSESLEITVYDIQGKLIQSTTSSNAKETINLQSAPKGMYFMMIKGQNSSMVKKIVID